MLRKNFVTSVKILLVLLMLILLLALVAPRILRLVVNGLLPEEDVTTYSTLDGLQDNQKLVVWRQGGGATVPYLTLASLLEEGDDVRAYINQPYSYANVFKSFKSEEICFEKISDNQVKIIYNGGDIQKQKKEFGGIIFTYEIGRCPEFTQESQF